MNFGSNRAWPGHVPLGWEKHALLTKLAGDVIFEAYRSAPSSKQCAAVSENLSLIGTLVHRPSSPFSWKSIKVEIASSNFLFSPHTMKRNWKIFAGYGLIKLITISCGNFQQTKFVSSFKNLFGNLFSTFWHLVVMIGQNEFPE